MIFTHTQNLNSTAIKQAFCSFTLLVLLTGCSTTLTAAKHASIISGKTGIPQESIRVAARCNYSSKKPGKDLEGASDGIFILTKNSLSLHSGSTADNVSRKPVYKINFTTLKSIGQASDGLNHQLHFYQKNRIFVVQLLTAFDGADPERSKKVFDHIRAHGVAKNPNTKLLPFMLVTSTQFFY